MATRPAPFKSYLCATVIDERRPKMKPHTNLGHAKSAVQGDYGHSAASIWTWSNEINDWELLWEFPANRGSDYEYPWETTQMKRRREAERDERFRRQVDEIDQRQRADRLRRELIEKGWTPPHD